MVDDALVSVALGAFVGLSVVTLGAVVWVTFKVKSARVESAQDLLEAGNDDQEPSDAIFAASFNPCHSGHVHILKAIARRHAMGKVFAVVGVNPEKVYAVSGEERRAVLEQIIRGDPGLRNVEAVVVEGYIWRKALAADKARFGAAGAASGRRCVMYRGIRTWAKDGQAEALLHVLNLVGPLLFARASPPETRFLTAPTSGALATVSSSEVRKRVKEGGDLRGLVPPNATDAITHLYSRGAPEEAK